MNNKFIEGKWYKLRDDYPVTPNKYDVITFEGRETAWIPAKQPFFDKEPRKVRKVIHFGYIGSHSWMIIFEGIKREGWRYHPEDFDQMDSDKFLVMHPNEYREPWIRVIEREGLWILKFAGIKNKMDNTRVYDLEEGKDGNTNNRKTEN